MDLFVDLTGQQLLSSPDAITPLSTLRIGETSIDEVNVWLLARTNGATPLAPQALPAGFSDIVVATRPAKNLEQATPLLLISSFTQIGSGSSLCYQGQLNCDADNIESIMAGLRNLNCLTDVWIQNANGSVKRPLVFQQNTFFYRAMYRAPQTLPMNNSANYPVPQAIFTYFASITGLTGGGATNLDGLATAEGASPRVVLIESYPLDEWKLVPSVRIASISVGNPAIVTTSTPHLLQNGQEAIIGGVANIAPAVPQPVAVTVIDGTHFSIPLNVTEGGTAGTVTPASNPAGGIVLPQDFDPATNPQWWRSR